MAEQDELRAVVGVPDLSDSLQRHRETGSVDEQGLSQPTVHHISLVRAEVHGA